MNTAKKIYLDHEKLIAYQRSIEFMTWSNPIVHRIGEEPGEYIA